MKLPMVGGSQFSSSLSEYTRIQLFLQLVIFESRLRDVSAFVPVNDPLFVSYSEAR